MLSGALIFSILLVSAIYRLKSLWSMFDLVYPSSWAAATTKTSPRGPRFNSELRRLFNPARIPALGLDEIAYLQKL